MSIWKRLKARFTGSNFPTQKDIEDGEKEAHRIIYEEYYNALNNEEKKLEDMTDEAFISYTEQVMDYTKNRLKELAQKGFEIDQFL